MVEEPGSVYLITLYLLRAYKILAKWKERVKSSATEASCMVESVGKQIGDNACLVLYVLTNYG